MPAAQGTRKSVRKTLEKHFRDVQDFEFTIEDGKVFMLQTRNGKRTGWPPSVSPSKWKEKLIDWKKPSAQSGRQLDQVLAPFLTAPPRRPPSASPKGLPAGPGRGLRQDLFQRRPRRRSRARAKKFCSSAMKLRRKICAA
jgi:pyruvate,orthophosphate dikinase